MANTFKALCDIADWSTPATVNTKEDKIPETTNHQSSSDNNIMHNDIPSSPNHQMNLHYNIQIHLPETTNMAVYDAIFQSLKKHLM